jgi:hypothetical protein
VDFTTDAEGIIFEIRRRPAVAQCSTSMTACSTCRPDAADFGEAADRGEASWQVTEGTATIEGR